MGTRIPQRQAVSRQHQSSSQHQRRAPRRSTAVAIAAAAALAASAAVSSPALADSGTWTNPAGGVWSDPANWSTSIVADGAGFSAIFDGLDVPVTGIAVSLDTTKTIGQLTFGDSDTLTSGTWTLSSTGNPLTLSGTPTVTVNAGATANISLSVVGTEGLTTGGPGTLILTGANSWSGGTTISGGTLQVGTGQAAAADVAAIGSGPITNNGTLTIFKTNAVNISENISGTGNLIKQGTSILTLGGTNSYTGTTTIDAGQIQFSAAAAVSGLSAGSVTANANAAVGYTAGSVLDSAFISKISAASTGALTLSAADAGTNLDFTSPALSPLANMSVGANGTIVYTGTITPAGGPTRVGGGGGTLQLQNAITSGDVVVGAGTGAGAGTVVFNAANTYAGTTTVNAGSTLNVGGGGAVGSLGTGDVTNNGTVDYSRTNSHTLANNFTGSGTFIRRNAGAAGATNLTITGNMSIGALFINRSGTSGVVNTVTVDGGTLVSSGFGTIQGGTGQGQLILNNGTINLNGGIQTDNNDSALIRVNGGTFTASDIGLARIGGTTNPTFGNGFVVAGGTATVGTLRVGRTGANSWGVASFEGGSTTITGAMTVGQTTNAGRGGAFRVIGGTFVSSDTVDGIIMGRTNGATTSQVSRAFFSGGTATVEKFKMGFDSTLIGGVADVNVQPGGALYVGSGGFVKGSGAGHIANVNLTGGTFGAKADYTATAGVNLVMGGTAAAVHAADASGNPFNITWNGVVSGAGNWTKSGGGTLTLNGANTYSGAVTVAAGTLAGTTSGLRGNITNNGNVTFDQSTGGAFSGVISGSGTVTKTGTGAAILSNPQTYTGATTITGGLLGINGAQATSGITVANGGGLLLAGNATVNALTFGATAGDAMTLKVNTGSGVNSLAVLTTDALVANGTTTVDVGSVGLTAGLHTLLDYSGVIGGAGFGGFTLGALPARIAGNLVHNVGATLVQLDVTNVDIPRWTGAVNGDWDIGTPDLATGTQNWKEVTSGNNTVYLETSVPGDQVLFDDTATGTTIVYLTTTLQPTHVAVNNSTLNYTFTGAGKISGPTQLVKQGSGTLSIGTANDYTGGTLLQAGTLHYANPNAVPTAGNLTITGGTLNIAGQFQDLSGALILDGGTITSGTITKTGSSYDLRSGTITSTANISGTAGATKSTAGTVIVKGNLAYSGPTVVNEGTLQLGDGVENGSTPGNITNAATVVFNNGGDQTFTSSILGFSGTVVKNGPATLTLTGSGNTAGNEGNATINGGTVVLVGSGAPPNPYHARLGRGGTITVNDGATVLVQQFDALGLNSAAQPAAVRLNTGGTLKGDFGSGTSLYNATFAGGTLTAEADAGWTMRGDYTAVADTTSTINAPTVGLLNAPSFDLAAGSTVNVSSSLTGGSGIEVLGSGTMNLTGTNSYTGATTVTAGTLNVTANAIPAANAVIVNGGTYAMSGGGPVFNPASMTVNGGQATLVAGGDKTLKVDTLTVAGGVLAMNDNDFIVDYTGASPEFTIRDYVKAFADNPAATSGISFTPGAGDVTIAVAEKTEWGQSVFNGVTLDDTTIIGKYTYYGDSNLDGAVTSDDYVAVDVGLGTGDSWVQGDFNFSGSVTSDDYVAIDVNLGKGSPTPLAWAELKSEMVALHTAMFGAEYVEKLAYAEANGFGATLVPEPGALSLVGLAAAGLLGRRRRRA